MQKFKFAVKSILNCYKSEKFLYFFLIIGLVISSLLLFVFGNYYFTDSQNLRELDKQNNRVIINLNDNNELKKISQFLSSKEDITNSTFEATIMNDSGSIRVAATQKIDFDPQRILVASPNGLKDGEFFISNQFAKYLEESTNKELKANIGTKMKIANLQLSCSGIIHTEEFDVLLSQSDFLKLSGIQFYTLIYNFENGTPLSKIIQLNSQIKKEFKITAISMPSETTSFSFWGLLDILGANTIFLIMSLLNCFFLYAYSIKRRYYMYSIYKLYGLNNLQTALLVVFEMTVLFFIAFGLALPIFYFFVNPILVNTISIGTFFYQIKYSFILLFVLNILFSLLFSRKLIKSTAIALYYESVVL